MEHKADENFKHCDNVKKHKMLGPKNQLIKHMIMKLLLKNIHEENQIKSFKEYMIYIYILTTLDQHDKGCVATGRNLSQVKWK